MIGKRNCPKCGRAMEVLFTSYYCPYCAKMEERDKLNRELNEWDCPEEGQDGISVISYGTKTEYDPTYGNTSSGAKAPSPSGVPQCSFRELIIGDTVTIKNNLIVGSDYDDAPFMDEMKALAGTTTVIRSKKYNSFISSTLYRLDADQRKWNWTQEMFE